MFSLRKVGDAEVATALMLLLDEEVESDVRVRQEATLTLGRIGGDGVGRVLAQALKEDSSPQVRSRAAMALSQLGETSLVRELEQALLSEVDVQVQEFIEEAIAKLR